MFVSYAHDDADAFVRRLVSDLERRGGHRVWWDTRDVAEGARFDVKIEQGIRDADVVAAVITSRSQREDSICRDEIVFAFVTRKPIVPLRVAVDVGPSLLLARRSWIDFTGDYERALDGFLRYLRGDHSHLSDPSLPSVSGVAPLDFGPDIARHVDGFTGRRWLNDQVGEWVASARERIMVLVGEPGMGKSAIAAWLGLHRSDEVIGIHFCSHSNPRTLHPAEFVASIVAQLESRLPGFGEAVGVREPACVRASAGDAFRALVVEPLRRVAAPAQHKLLVVDALDEAVRQGESIVDVLATHQRDLPVWLRVFATSRPEAAVLERFAGLVVTSDLGAVRLENRTDVERYASERLLKVVPDTATDALAASSIAERVAGLASGNFLIARLLLDGIERGDISAGDLSRVVPGRLAAFYAADFYRLFPDVDQYRQTMAPLLRALIAAQGPLPGWVVDEIVGESHEESRARIRRLRFLLRVEGIRESLAYQVFHRSVVEWLSDPECAGPYFVDARSGHEALAAVGWNEYRRRASNMSEYMVAHLPTHLLQSSRLEQLLAVVLSGDLRLLERWTSLGEGDVGMSCLDALSRFLERDKTATTTVAGLATQMARIHTLRGEYGQAHARLDFALRTTAWRYQGRRVRAIAHHEMGSLCLYQSDHAGAKGHYRSALWLCRFGVSRMHDEEAANLVALAVVAAETHQLKETLALAHRGLRVARKGKDLPHLVAAVRLLAVAHRGLGRYDAAIEHIATGLEHCDRHKGLHLERLRLLVLRSWVRYDQALLGLADSVTWGFDLDEAHTLARAAASLYGVAETTLGLTWRSVLRGDVKDARLRFDHVEHLLPEGRLFDLHAGLAVSRAAAHRLSGHPEAESAYESAVRACTQHDIVGWGIRAYVGLGALQFHAGRADEASEAWNKGVTLAGKVSPAKQQLVRVSIRLCQAGLTAVAR